MNIINGSINRIPNFEIEKERCVAALAGLDTSGISNLQITHSENDNFAFKVYLSFENLNGERGHGFLSLETDSIQQGALSLVTGYICQRDCEHAWEPSYDDNQNEYVDGRGQCKKCGLKSKRVLEKKSGNVISMYKENDIVATEDWPNDIFIQGGSRGVVVKTGDGPGYVTCFVETFPDIDGYGTFLRGEGKTVLEAEQACFKLYKKQILCKDHKWSREVNGSHRKDGYAVCESCGLEATALEPETSCYVCDKPTTGTLNKRHICHTHQVALGVDKYIKEKACEPKVSLFSSELNDESELARYYFDFRIKEIIIKQKGEGFYLEHSTAISDLKVKCGFLLSEKLFGDELKSLTSIEQAKSNEAKIILLGVHFNLDKIFETKKAPN